MAIAHDHKRVAEGVMFDEAADAIWYAVRMIGAARRSTADDDERTALSEAHAICTSALGVLSRRLTGATDPRRLEVYPRPVE